MEFERNQFKGCQFDAATTQIYELQLQGHFLFASYLKSLTPFLVFCHWTTSWWIWFKLHIWQQDSRICTYLGRLEFWTVAHHMSTHSKDSTCLHHSHAFQLHSSQSKSQCGQEEKTILISPHMYEVNLTYCLHFRSCWTECFLILFMRNYSSCIQAPTAGTQSFSAVTNPWGFTEHWQIWSGDILGCICADSKRRHSLLLWACVVNWRIK
jgi:hypothetical protein